MFSFFKFNSVLNSILILSQIFVVIESIFSINELSTLIRAKKLLLRELPHLMSQEPSSYPRAQPSAPRELPLEPRFPPIARYQRQLSSDEKTASDKTGVHVIDGLFDSRSLMSLIALKQKIVANIAVLIRRLIDEIALTLRLILRVFTTPLLTDSGRALKDL